VTTTNGYHHRSTEGDPADVTRRISARVIAQAAAAVTPGPVDPAAASRGRGRPPARGWRGRGGGAATNIDTGRSYQGTTTQVCGLFPFAASSGAQVRGVPIGRDMHTAEPIGLDPGQWLQDGLITNTGVWIQAQPGVGKSAISKRICTGLVGFGFGMVVPGDVKGEYTPLVEALGGVAYRIGRGLHTVNPLDAGPLRAAIDAATGSRRQELLETVRARRLSLLEALVVIVQAGPVDTMEKRLLAVAVDAASAAAEAAGTEPIIPDVARVLTRGTQECMRIVAARDDHEYARETRTLRATLELLCEGAIRGLFDGPSTIAYDASTAVLSLDISALDGDADDVVAAAMMCSSAWTSTMVESSLASGRRRNVVEVSDELWRRLRAAPGLVELSDRVTRLNRARGVVSLQITHSLSDLEALPTEQDRAKARGMAARNGIVILGGLDAAELDRLSAITPLTSGERALVTSWAAPPTWHRGLAHPGRGKYLIKSGERLGLPVAMSLTPSERDLYNTDGAWATTTEGASGGRAQ
jgi:hypothetical protein